MKTIKKITIVLLSLFISGIQPLFASISEEEKNQVLEDLNKNSKPNLPIFGKVTEPIKAGVALYRYVPEKIYLEKQKEDFPKEETIALLPVEKEEGVLKLEEKRKELQKAEIEGLNYIQPSLELTENEQKAIDEFFTRNEQEQLLHLWEATIERNKTIQYIIQRLAPQDSAQNSKSALSKTIGAAIFLPFYAVQAFTNNQGAYFGSEVGSRVLGSVLQGKMKNKETQLQLSQTEAIVLFMMIDEVAERLRRRYHDYKRSLIERALATSELEEAKKDSLDASEDSTHGAELLANINRRSVEREVRRLDTEVRYYKNSLIELAGLETINELDNQLKLELAAAKNTPLDFVPIERK